MNKREFITELKSRLAGFRREDVAEITGLYSEIVTDLMKDGKSEEEAVAATGGVDAAAKRAAAELYQKPVGRGKTARELTLNGLPDTVRIRVRASGIYVCRSGDGKVHIKYDEYRFKKYEYRDVGGEAEFSSRRRGFLSALGAFFTCADARCRRPVVLELPEGFAGRLELHTGCGSVSLDGIEAGCLYVRSACGKVRFEGGRITHTADIRTSNGRIDTDNVTCQRLAASTGNGKVSGSEICAETYSGRTSNSQIFVSKIEAGEISLLTSNGSVTAAVCGSSSDYAAEVHTSNGSVYVQGNKYTGRVYNPAARRKIHAKTSNGKIKIDFVGEA